MLSLTDDKGYHDAIELTIIQHETGVRTVIGVPCFEHGCISLENPARPSPDGACCG